MTLTAVLLAMVANIAANAQPRWQAMVINLKRRPDRLQRFVKAMKDNEPWVVNDGKLCRVEGRDGRVLMNSFKSGRHRRLGRPHTSTGVPMVLDDPSSLVNEGWITQHALEKAEIVGTNWPEMTAGGIGLYLAHADAWRHVRDADLDYGMIFEDDLTLFAPNFDSQVHSLLGGQNDDNATSPWDFMYLQRCNDESWKKKRVSGKDAHASRKNTGWSQMVELPSGETVPCTGAYIITRKGAEALLSGAVPAIQQLDQQLGAVPGLRRSALSPPVAQCQEVYSDGTWTYRDTDVQPADTNLEKLPDKLAKWLGLIEVADDDEDSVPNCNL